MLWYFTGYILVVAAGSLSSESNFRPLKSINSNKIHTDFRHSLILLGLLLLKVSARLGGFFLEAQSSYSTHRQS